MPSPIKNNKHLKLKIQKITQQKNYTPSTLNKTTLQKQLQKKLQKPKINKTTKSKSNSS